MRSQIKSAGEAAGPLTAEFFKEIRNEPEHRVQELIYVTTERFRTVRVEEQNPDSEQENDCPKVLPHGRSSLTGTLVIVARNHRQPQRGSATV